jgi:hypothetical protein
VKQDIVSTLVDQPWPALFARSALEMYQRCRFMYVAVAMQRFDLPFRLITRLYKAGSFLMGASICGMQLPFALSN